MKILITRPRAQTDMFMENLSKAGMEPICFPVIEIHPIQDNLPLQNALSKLQSYDWVVFTSANGVQVVFNEMERLKIKSLPKKLKLAAIGPKTAAALKTHNAHPVFVPDEYVAEAIVPGMGDLKDRWVLLPRAELARKALSRAIGQAGGIAHEVPVYQTLPASPDPIGLKALHEGVDVITLTSSSTAKNFAAIVRTSGLDPQHLPKDPVFACIGPITEQTAQEEGLPNRIIADEYTTEGLIRAIEALTTR